MYYGEIPDHRRRIIHSVGDGFILGGAYGCAIPFVRGFRGSPSGTRLAAGAQEVLRKAPRHAGWMAAFSAVLFSVDTAMSLARRREDPWNPIAGGAVALALLRMRRGARAAALSAPVGAVAVAVPLGVVWYMSELMSRVMSRTDTLAYLNPRPGAAWVFPDEPSKQLEEKKKAVRNYYYNYVLPLSPNKRLSENVFARETRSPKEVRR